MKRKIQYNIKKSTIIILLFYYIINASTVKLIFYDSVEVNDTFFTVGDIACVISKDSAIINKIKDCFAGKSAPPGYVRPVSTMDIVNYFLKNKFPKFNFIYNNKSFVYVKTANIEVPLNFFTNEIFNYVATQVKWKEGDWKIDLINSNEKVSYLKRPFTLEISGLDEPYPRGNKNIILTIKQKGYTKKVDVRCKFTINTEVAIAAKEIKRGSIIKKDDFVMKRIDITHLSQLPILDATFLENKQIICSVREGNIIQKRMIKDIPVIEKGEEVSIVLRNNGIIISVPAISREKGNIGDYIWVENTITHKLIRAKVEKKGVVIVKSGGV